MHTDRGSAGVMQFRMPTTAIFAHGVKRESRDSILFVMNGTKRCVTAIITTRAGYRERKCDISKYDLPDHSIGVVRRR
jgi:hypothetical protein